MSASDPDWSPGGSKIAFRTLSDIYVVNVDGSGLQNLTNSPATNASPSWSPDGSKIAFSSDRDGDPDIYVMNADGSGLTRLTDDPARDVVPVWSPDGTRIAFTSYRDGNGEIYVMDANGENERNLTNDPAQESSSTWAPDGTKLAFVSNRDGVSQIYTMNADGSGVTRVTNHPRGAFAPSWQPLPPRYAFSGFLAPVDNPPTVNVVKAGSAIPIKFSLGGDQGLDIFRAGYPRFVSEPCSGSTGPQDAVEVTTADSRSSLSYDPATQQYTYVWKTDKSLAGQCGRLELGLDDGSTHYARFRFTR